MAAASSDIRDRVLQALGTVEDPSMASAGLDLSIIDLGLVVDVGHEGARVEVDLTFTESGCAFSHHVLDRATRALESIQNVEEVVVTPTWRERWSRDRLSSEATATIESTTSRLEDLKAATAGPSPPTATPTAP